MINEHQRIRWILSAISENTRGDIFDREKAARSYIQYYGKIYAIIDCYLCLSYYECKFPNIGAWWLYEHWAPSYGPFGEILDLK